jgi:CRP/FNR family cyclic AMP-dependent transcriptional regulator
MLAPYGISVIDDCRLCPAREKYGFCSMDSAGLWHLNTITATAVYPKGTLLFLEGQSPRGVFVLCNGKAKLRSTGSGRAFIHRLCDAGSILGLTAVLLERPYEATAEMIEPGQANFIKTEAFLQFVNYGDIALRLAKQLGSDNYLIHQKLKILALTKSPAKRFARLVQLMLPSTVHTGAPMQIAFPYSQQEVAEMIGSTRETVGRLFNILRTNRVIEKRGIRLTVHDSSKLEEVCELARVPS